jgi:hypothetical protein
VGVIVSARSDATAPISIASVPSAIISPAPGPRCRRRARARVPGSITSFVRPSVRSSVARGRSGPGELRDLDLAPCFCASVSVSPPRPAPDR